MALSQKQKQQKREKKSAKKKSRGRGFKGEVADLARGIREIIASPVYACLVEKDIEETGIGLVVFSRRMAGGEIAFSIFLLDIACVGVKNAFFSIQTEEMFNKNITEAAPYPLEAVHPSCARKLVEGAVEFAARYNLRPHKDYITSKLIFGDFDPGVCPNTFEYGRDGKPFYIPGPDDDSKTIKRILDEIGQKDVEYIVDISEGVSEDQLDGYEVKDGAFEFEVTENKLPDETIDRLSDEERKALDKLYHEALLGKKSAIPILHEWNERLPGTPILYNYLSVAYMKSGNKKKAEEINNQCREKFPDYLFSKINYCNFHMDRGNSDVVPEIFHGRFDISYHIEGRTIYHVSEFAGFYFLMVRYHVMIGKNEIAENFLKILEQVTPNHPATEDARWYLRPGFIERLIGRRRRRPD